MGRKISFLLVILGLAVAAGIQAGQNASLRGQVKELQAELLEEPKADEELQERLDRQYEEEQAQKEDEQEIRILVEAFLAAVYQAPSGEYGPVPYVPEYLTDEGILSMLLQIDPVAYGSLAEEELQAIRSGEITDGKENSAGAVPELFTQKMYIDVIAGELSADVLLFADCNLSEGDSLPTFSILLQVECMGTGADGWRIDRVREFRQL